MSVLVVGHALLQHHVGSTELVAESLIDGVILLREVLGLRALPGVAPSAVQTAHLVGVGAGEKNTGALLQGQNGSLVLQQHLRLLGRTQGFRSKLVRAELLIALAARVGLVEESQAILHA